MPSMGASYNKRLLDEILQWHKKKVRVKNETICCKEQRARNLKTSQTDSGPGAAVPVVQL